jgi:hypothetical protein
MESNCIFEPAYFKGQKRAVLIGIGKTLHELESNIGKVQGLVDIRQVNCSVHLPGVLNMKLSCFLL